MKTTRKILVVAIFLSTLGKNAHAHPGHDGHELIWDFHSHGLWDSPITFAIGVLVSAALVFRLASRQK